MIIHPTRVIRVLKTSHKKPVNAIAVEIASLQINYDHLNLFLNHIIVPIYLDLPFQFCKIGSTNKINKL